MKALSWKNPYGTLMLHEKIETRSWNTNYRGPVLICVSQKEYSPEEVLLISGEQQYNRIRDLLGDSGEKEMLAQRGYAIAIGELVDCRPMRSNDEQNTFVRYNSNLYCHVYKNVQLIEPIPWKGSQGWKDVPAEIAAQIKVISE